MGRVAIALSMLWCLACGGTGKQAGTGAAPVEAGDPAVAQPQAGCPDDFVPSVVYRTEVGPWDRERVPLFLLHDSIIVEEDEDPWARERAWDRENPEFRRPNAAEAKAAGVDTSATPLWIYTGAGEPSCRATPARPVIIHDGPAFAYTSVGMELETDGCGIGDEWYALALRQEARPECRLELATTGLGVDKAALLAMGLPDEFAAALRGEKCTKPCEVLWRLSGVHSQDGPGFYDLTITHLVRDPKQEEECMWEVNDWYGVLFRPGPGQPLQLIDEAEGLYATVQDARGTRAVIMSEDGQVAVHHIVDDGKTRTLRPGIAFDWFIIHEEDAVWHSLGESCL